MLQRVSSAFRIFYHSQQFAGILLLTCTLVSLAVSHFDMSGSYVGFWHKDFFHALQGIHLPASVGDWINDGLMAVFFLLIGLEIKREVVSGELSSYTRASLPVAAALGGMILPASIYLLFNAHTPLRSGWGIPMATDIAFALGILSLMGDRVPHRLRILLTALAVADDLGAVLVIAFFYTSQLNFVYLGVGALLTTLLFFLHRRKVQNLTPFLVIGGVLWYVIHLSGVHATIVGVVVALFIPFDAQRSRDPLQRLETMLHQPVNYLIMPLFALANTAFILPDDLWTSLQHPESAGIIFGLTVGKPLGIVLAVYLAVKAGWSRLADGMTWKEIAGVGMLGGIGFTMSMFIALLAFDDVATIEQAKVGILTASLLSGLMGAWFLSRSLRKS